jgi:hypothetical protein
MTASTAEVKEAYRSLVKVWHPDRFGDDAKLRLKAEEKLKQINLAYEAIMSHRSGKGTSQSHDASGHEERGHADTPQEFYQKGVDCIERQDQPENYVEAGKWFEKAARLGYAPAQCYLGLLYSMGNGVPQNITTACQWYTKAAEQRNGAAMYHLGLLYGKGIHRSSGVRALKHLGVEVGDKVESYKWLYLAVLYGVKEAIPQIRAANTPQTAAGTNEARLRAAYLFPNYQDTTPPALLAGLVRHFLRLVRDGGWQTIDRKGDQKLYANIIGEFGDLEKAVSPLAYQTYATAKAGFMGVSLSAIMDRWKFTFGARETTDLVKKFTSNLVYSHSERLPLDFGVLRVQSFNYIWVKEIMPQLLARKGK